MKSYTKYKLKTNEKVYEFDSNVNFGNDLLRKSQLFSCNAELILSFVLIL